jgi:hypothetical protein
MDSELDPVKNFRPVSRKKHGPDRIRILNTVLYLKYIGATLVHGQL